MPRLDELPCFDDDGHVRVVVESPRGSRVKLAYDPEVGAMVAKRLLPAGLAYPYDWGFVAGTRAADGDPLDAMVLAETGTWPGVIVPVVAIGVVAVVQRERRGAKAIRNDRIIAVPADDAASADLADLARARRRELEAFFVHVGRLAHAEVRVAAWRGRAAAERAIRAACRPPPA